MTRTFCCGVEPVIMVHHFVVDPQVPSRFLTDQNCDVKSC